MFLFFLQVSKEGAQSIQVFPIHKWSLKFDQGESMIGKGNWETLPHSMKITNKNSNKIKKNLIK